MANAQVVLLQLITRSNPYPVILSTCTLNTNSIEKESKKSNRPIPSSKKRLYKGKPSIISAPSEHSKTNKMGNVMGKKKPLSEVLRENKRMINRAVRELDREKQGLEREEQRLTIEIKKAARANQMASVRIMAKVSFKSS
jgi:transcriptional regulator with GAF, ATPase, and Fis domain